MSWKDGPSWRDTRSYVGSLRETAEERDQRLQAELRAQEASAPPRIALPGITSLDLVSEIAARSDQELELQNAIDARNRAEAAQQQRQQNQARQQLALDEQTSNPLGLHYEPPPYAVAEGSTTAAQSSMRQQPSAVAVAPPSYNSQPSLSSPPSTSQCSAADYMPSRTFVSPFAHLSNPAHTPHDQQHDRDREGDGERAQQPAQPNYHFQSPRVGMFEWDHPSSLLGQHLQQEHIGSAPTSNVASIPGQPQNTNNPQQQQSTLPVALSALHLTSPSLPPTYTPSQLKSNSGSSTTTTKTETTAPSVHEEQPPTHDRGESSKDTVSLPPLSDLPPGYEAALNEAMGKEDTKDAVKLHSISELFVPSGDLPAQKRGATTTKPASAALTEHYFTPDPSAPRLRCSSCFDPIQPDAAKNRSGVAVKKGISTYHVECYERVAAPPCGHCGRTLYAHPDVGLSGIWGEYKGRRYHIECYQFFAGPRCCSCWNVIFADPAKGLSGGWRDLGDCGLIHEECYQRRLAIKRDIDERNR